MLAMAAFLDVAEGMITTFPMKLWSEMAWLSPHDHLFKHRAQYPLARLCLGGGMANFESVNVRRDNG